jgi:hypothetical protein
MQIKVKKLNLGPAAGLAQITYSRSASVTMFAPLPTRR